MVFWEAKQRQVCKTLALLGGLHLSFPYKFNNGFEAAQKQCTEENPFTEIIS